MNVVVAGEKSMLGEQNGLSLTAIGRPKSNRPAMTEADSSEFLPLITGKGVAPIRPHRWRSMPAALSRGTALANA